MRRWIIFIAFLQMTVFVHQYSAIGLDERELGEVLKNFIHVSGMKMDEYNYWWYPVSLQDCAENCLEDETMHCKSFSYCREDEACSTFERGREDCPELFNPPGFLKNDPRGHMMWDYFERKSDKYKRMEKQIDNLRNLSEINVEEASRVLNSVTGLMFSDDEETTNQNKSSVSSGDLDLAGRSLMLIMKLNPIANATLDDAKEFTDLVINVSSALTQPIYAAAWQAAQKDPSSPGCSAIVTSTEHLTTSVSEKLLAAQNATKGIQSEADDVAVWMNFASFHTHSAGNEHDEDSNKKHESNTSSSGIQLQNDPHFYTFPNSRNFPESSDDNDEDLASEVNSFLDDVIILPRTAFGNKSIITNVRYKNLRRAMPTRSSDNIQIPAGSKLRENKMNSAVLTTSIFPRPPHDVFVDDPVTIIFRHNRRPQYYQNVTGNITITVRNSSAEDNSTSGDLAMEENMFCVFWQESQNDEDGGEWSQEGCSLVDFNQTHTICSCTHLTSFGVLLQIVDYNVDDEFSKTNQQVLSAISKAGCVLSLIGVGIMCAAFIKLRLHTENIKIHFNLGVAVGLADLTFLFIEFPEGGKDGCATMTVFLYYFNMSVLTWMLIEGLHLYAQVVVVFVSVRRRFKYYALAGWGFPLVALLLSAAILNNRIGSHESCWLSPADNSIWAFALPALVVIITNSFVLLSVVRIIVRIQPGKSKHLKVSKLRNAVKGSIFLFPLLGTTWIFGILSVSKETIVFQYLFAITNSLQGFFLFIFHCVCNSEVREDARRHKWFGSSDSTVTSSNPHILSHAFSFNVANGLRRFRNSISFEIPSSLSSTSEDPSECDAKAVQKRRKFNTMFTKMLSNKLPSTITEKEEKYEESETIKRNLTCSRRSSINTNPDKSLPLPGMPVKNDTIDLDRFKTSMPTHNSANLDQWLINQMVQNALKEMFKEITPAEEEMIKKTLFSDEENDEKTEEERKIKMSYDSGLNSIENDSVLDDEEMWKDEEESIKDVQDDCK